MRELILSDITEMGQGFCVIGVEHVAQDTFRSVRPVPQGAMHGPTHFPISAAGLYAFILPLLVHRGPTSKTKIPSDCLQAMSA